MWKIVAMSFKTPELLFPHLFDTLIELYVAYKIVYVLP